MAYQFPPDVEELVRKQMQSEKFRIGGRPASRSTPHA